MARLGAALCLALGLLGPAVAAAQGRGGAVYLVEVKGEIDLGLAPYIRRILRTAQGEGAAAVVVAINTPGGRLDAALDIKNALLDSAVPTIAFVNREAFSAGALIAIATHEVYMAPGAVVGAATPVVGGTGETADEKVVSAVRKDFAAAAEARGRDPRVAEAMVDPDVEVPGLVERGKLLTLTTGEALEWGYAEGEVASLDALLALKGLEGRPLVATSPGLAERLVRLLTNPLVASLLFSLGVLGLLAEFLTPGFGLPGILGASFLVLFFWGHMLAGLAGWEGVALVVLGVALLALEVLVVPGFGVAGVLGVAAFLAGMYLSLVGRVPTTFDYVRALSVVTGSLLLMLVGGLLFLRFLPKRTLGGLVLQDRLGRLLPAAAPAGGVAQGAATAPPADEFVPLVAARGVALTDLHPAGVARIQGRRVDVLVGVEGARGPGG